MRRKARVFVVDDDELIVVSLSRALKKEGYNVIGAHSARGLAEKISAWSPDVVLLDITLPGGSGLEILQEIREREIDTAVVMVTADDSADTATRAMKSGAADYLTKPFELDEVRLVVRTITEKQRLKQEVEYLRKGAADRGERRIVGSSPVMQELTREVEKLATAGVHTVLITGESGVGKEVVARSLHRGLYGEDTPGYSPFIGVNCTALPDSLIENELFGHEKGAFTDARNDKKGLFELAEGGTLLLDEIGDMPLSLQAKLLRVLEERVVRRIGGKEDIPIDVTVMASTNRDLPEIARRGDFRIDLFYRLSAFTLNVPPVRERGRDALELAEYFLTHLCKKYGKEIVKRCSSACEEAFLSYPWPGNVRELRNVVERIVVLGNVDELGVENIPREIVAAGDVNRGASGSGFVLPKEGLSLDELKKDMIVQALARTGHNKMRAATLLDISYDTLRYQMKHLGIQ